MTTLKQIAISFAFAITAVAVAEYVLWILDGPLGQAPAG
jgi:hypothetical protein